MIVQEGKSYFPYVLYTDHGTVMGLDSRSAADVEKEWLARAKKGTEREALQARAHARSEVHNMRLLRQKVEGDPTIPGHQESITLDEVASPPAETFDDDEVLRLEGLPGGYGRVAMIAMEVAGIARAGGEEAADFCNGCPTFVHRVPKAGDPRRKSKTKRGPLNGRGR